jgi:hypothetical protein
MDIYKIIGYDPHNLLDTEENKRLEFYFKVRACHKIMLYVHSQLNFPRMFDPDQGEYKKYYLPISYNPFHYTQTKIANCGIYSNYFELLCELAKFEVRHIGLKDPDGRCGHWCSEIKINEKWIFFDPMYLICPITFDKEGRKFYSAYEIMQDPINLYFNSIPPLLQGISKETISNLWKGLEINKHTSYELGLNQFVKLFYGEKIDEQ